MRPASMRPDGRLVLPHRLEVYDSWQHRWSVHRLVKKRTSPTRPRPSEDELSSPPVHLLLRDGSGARSRQSMDLGNPGASFDMSSQSEHFPSHAAPDKLFPLPPKSSPRRWPAFRSGALQYVTQRRKKTRFEYDDPSAPPISFSRGKRFARRWGSTHPLLDPADDWVEEFTFNNLHLIQTNSGTTSPRSPGEPRPITWTGPPAPRILLNLIYESQPPIYSFSEEPRRGNK